MKYFLLAGLASAQYPTDVEKVDVGSVRCNGETTMTVGLETVTAELDNDSHVLGQFECPGDASMGAADFDYDGSEVTFNPYQCNGDANPTGNDMEDFSTGDVTIKFHLMFKDGNNNILLTKYSAVLSCTFQNSYSASVGTKVQEKQTTQDANSFDLQNTFGITLGAGNLGNDMFRANTMISATVASTPAANGGSFADLANSIEWAISQCEVQGTGADVFEIFAAALGGNACGQASLSWAAQVGNMARGTSWTFQYRAFVFQGDANNDEMDYTLECTINLCNVGNDQSNCTAAKTCSDTTEM